MSESMHRIARSKGRSFSWDLDVGRLVLEQALAPGVANIPSYYLLLSALADRGEPFTVESTGFQGGPKRALAASSGFA